MFFVVAAGSCGLFLEFFPEKVRKIQACTLFWGKVRAHFGALWCKGKLIVKTRYSFHDQRRYSNRFF